MKILTTLFAILLPTLGIAQINIIGHVTDTHNDTIFGCTINEYRSVNCTISGPHGEFSISVTSETTLIEFSFIGFEKLRVRVDTIDKNDFHAILTPETITKDVFVIAPSPPYVEIGYMGLLKNRPEGLHIEYSRWGNQFRSHLNITTNKLDNILYVFELGPYRFGKSKIYNYLNIYAKGMIDQKNSDLFLCNRIFAKRRFAFNFGLGNEIKQNADNKLIFMTGVQTYLPFPFFNNILDFNAFYNAQTFDFTTSIYFEFYNKNYRNLSLSFGYQSLFGAEDYILNLNYKHYLYKRDKK